MPAWVKSTPTGSHFLIAITHKILLKNCLHGYAGDIITDKAWALIYAMPWPIPTDPVITLACGTSLALINK